MELITPIDRKALKSQIENAVPFPHFCIDNFLDERFANEIYDSFHVLMPVESSVNQARQGLQRVKDTLKRFRGR